MLPRMALGHVRSDPQHPYHHRGMIQHLPDGQVAFHHRTSGAKALAACSGSEEAVEGCRCVVLSGI